MAAVGRRIGLLGGSFDPVHQGHIHVAQTACRQLHLDQVWFLPTVETPLKDRGLAPFSERVMMLRMALAPFRRFKVSLVETKNTLPSYSINTARRLHAMYPDDTFFWLIGSDWVAGLKEWKDIEQLRRLVTFACLRRDEDDDLQDVLTITGAIHPASSTAIRNGDFRYMPDCEKAFIMEKGLYDLTIAQSLVTAKRWPHVQSVAKLCGEIAAANGLDGRQAQRAGLYHDCAKRMTPEQMEPWMAFCASERQHSQNVNIWHQYVGAALMSRTYKMRDGRILTAIGHHVLGDCREPLAMVVYAADKLDPSRGYNSAEQIALCKHDLNRGFSTVLSEQQEYLQQHGVIDKEG